MPSLRVASLDLLDVATTAVSTEVDMAASRQAIWDTIVDNSTWPQWFDGCRSCPAEPMVWTAVGDTRTIDVRPLVAREVCVAFDPLARWAFSITHTNLPMARAVIEMLDFEDTSRNGETRTNVRWTAALDLGPMYRISAGFTTGRMIDAWGRSLENLAARLS